MQTRIVGRSEFNLFHLLYSIVLSRVPAGLPVKQRILVMDISDAIATGVVCSAGRVAGMAGCLLLRPEMADHAWAVQGEHWATFETMRASRV